MKVNSTMASAVTAKKLGIEVAHVEAGLRSHDMTMPEEINRLCTDVLCDLLFATDRFASENLLKEGVAKEKIHVVGNLMIDTLKRHQAKAEQLTLMSELGLEPDGFATLTLHRPSNVDERSTLLGLFEALSEIAQRIPIVFPIHPRTRRMAEEFGLTDFFSSGGKARGLWVCEPLGYLELLHLNMNARLVLTDSGGLQEETTVLGVPCLTLRRNTERPITCTEGTNRVVGNVREQVLHAALQTVDGKRPRGRVPEKWEATHGRSRDRGATVVVGQLRRTRRPGGAAGPRRPLPPPQGRPRRARRSVRPSRGRRPRRRTHAASEAAARRPAGVSRHRMSPGRQ